MCLKGTCWCFPAAGHVPAYQMGIPIILRVWQWHRSRSCRDFLGPRREAQDRVKVNDSSPLTLNSCFGCHTSRSLPTVNGPVMPTVLWIDALPTPFGSLLPLGTLAIELYGTWGETLSNAVRKSNIMVAGILRRTKRSLTEPRHLPTRSTLPVQKHPSEHDSSKHRQ